MKPYALLALLLFPSWLMGESVLVDGVYYALDQEKRTASVSFRPYDDDPDGWMYYDASELYVGDLVVPDSIEYSATHYRVTSIGNYALAGSKQLRSLSLPASILTIGEGAFTLCNALNQIDVEESNPAFFSDRGVLYQRNPFSIYLVPRAYQGTIHVLSGVETIPSSAFQYCTLVDSIFLPNDMKTIKDGAFDHAQSLVYVSLGNELTTIERNAFSYTALEQIVLPSTLLQIGFEAFYECSNLKTIYNLSSLPLQVGSTDYGYVAYYADTIISSLPTSIITPQTNPSQNPQIILENGLWVIQDQSGRRFSLLGNLLD